MRPEHLRFKLNFKDAYYLQYTEEQLSHTLRVLENVGIDKTGKHTLTKNSTNCQFFLFESPTTKQTYFTKVQIDPASDPLDTDVSILSAIHKYIREMGDPEDVELLSKHFPELIAGTPLVLEWKMVRPIQAEANFNKYFDVADPKENYFSDEYDLTRLELTCPSMITNAINRRPICVFDFLKTTRDAISNHTPTCMDSFNDIARILGFAPKTKHKLMWHEYITLVDEMMNTHFFPQLYNMFHALLRLSDKSKFIHNDLHCGNVLYDVINKCFVIIDFGRSYIDIPSIPELKESICAVMPDTYVIDKNHAEIATMHPNLIFKLGSDMKKLTCKGAGIVSNSMLYYNFLRLNPSRVFPFQGAHYGKDTLMMNMPALNDVSAVSMYVYEALSSLRHLYGPKFREHLESYFSFDSSVFVVLSDIDEIMRLIASPPPGIVGDATLSCLFPGLMWMSVLILTYSKHIPVFCKYYPDRTVVSVKGLQSHKNSREERLFYTTWVVLKVKFQIILDEIIPLSHKFSKNLMAYHQTVSANTTLANHVTRVKSHNNDNIKTNNNSNKSSSKSKPTTMTAMNAVVGGNNETSLKELTKAYERIFEVGDQLRAPSQPTVFNKREYNIARNPYPSRTELTTYINTRQPLEAHGGRKVAIQAKTEKIRYMGRDRKVRFDSNKQRYILVDGGHVYLKTIRGKYRYV